MAKNVYEGMFILESNRYGRDPQAASTQIAELIEKAGGELLVSRLWEERRLAYTIKGYRKGTYWLTYFRLDGGQLGGIERKCQLTENILRVLFLKVDPRIVETLVEHAQTGHSGAAKKEAESGTKETGPKAGEAAVAVAERTEGDKPEASEQKE